MCKREVKHKQEEAEQLNWYRFSPTEKWYEDKLRDWSKVTLNWNKITDEMWTTFPEEEDQQISNIITKGKEFLYIYKNYIYRGKN